MKTIIILAALFVSAVSFAEAESIGSGLSETLELKLTELLHGCDSNCSDSDIDRNRDAIWSEAFEQAQPLDIKKYNGKKAIFWGKSSFSTPSFIAMLLDLRKLLPMASIAVYGESLNHSEDAQALSNPEVWSDEYLNKVNEGVLFKVFNGWSPVISEKRLTDEQHEINLTVA